MIKINFNDVQIPKNLESRIKEEREKKVNSAIGTFIREEGKLVAIDKARAEGIYKPVEYRPLDFIVNAIEMSIGSYIEEKYRNKESGSVMAPLDVRKMIAKINGKIMDMEGGLLELSDEQADFLLEVSRSDLPINDMFVWFMEYLEEQKVSQKEK